MILHPGVIALLLGAVISFSLILYASIIGLKIMIHWDYSSSSEDQLHLERRTYLVSTLVSMVLLFSIFSGLLFLYTIDEIHPLFIGAMCGTGTLNANPIGWMILLSKCLIFFFGSLWLIFNTLDQKCEDAPLVRYKYGALPILLLLLALDMILQIRFFMGLHPEKITSCCGSLFGAGSETVAGELAAVPPAPTMWIFYITSSCILTTLIFSLFNQSARLRSLLLVEALLFLPLALVSILSFISLYIYEMPSHHCPFDMIQNNYHYIGYPLYIGLFGGVLYAMAPGLSRFLPNRASMVRERLKSERPWLLRALFLLLIFVGLATGSILFGNLHLFSP